MMHQFKDNAGRTWDVTVTVDEIKRVKSLTGEDLARVLAGKPSLLDRLCGDSEGCIDIIALCDILFACCKPQADAQNVTDVDFGKGLGGEGLQEGQRALMEELQLFFSGLGKADLKTAIAKKMELVEMGIREADKAVGQIDVEKLAEKTRSDVATILGKSSTVAPESSASTPERSPSGS